MEFCETKNDKEESNLHPQMKIKIKIHAEIFANLIKQETFHV